MKPKELTRLREKSGYTVDELAEELCMDRASVYRWEQGVVDITPSRAKMIRLVLKMRGAA